MAAVVVYVGGSRGGAGKSLLAATVVDHVVVRGLPSPLIVDADASNFHTYLPHKAWVPAPVQLHLDTEDSWLDVAALCGEPDHRDRVMVIDGPARDAEVLNRHVDFLQDMAVHLDRPFTVLWVAVGRRNSAEALVRLLELVKRSPDRWCRVVIARNEGKPGRQDFSVHDGSKVLQSLLRDLDVAQFVVPTAAERIAGEIEDSRLTLRAFAGEEALPDSTAAAGRFLNQGHALAVKQWRARLGAAFDKVGLIPGAAENGGNDAG
ncbi:MAG: hypothetical protein F4Y02_15815 [Chloroflexi bacterium]|nr:hypothetical protein [Chloroflexota bacterium]